MPRSRAFEAPPAPGAPGPSAEPCVRPRPREARPSPCAAPSGTSESSPASSEVARRLPADAPLVCVETSRGRLRAYGAVLDKAAAGSAAPTRSSRLAAPPPPPRSRSSSSSFVVREERLGAHVHVINALASFLLPAGFPDSVAPEYSRYMFWRGVQYFFGGALSVYTTRSLLGALGGGSKFETKAAEAPQGHAVGPASPAALASTKASAAPPAPSAAKAPARPAAPSSSGGPGAPPPPGARFLSVPGSLQKTQKAAHVVTRKVARSAARASSASTSRGELSKDAGAAAIRWALKDGAGRFGRFLFARWGRALDGELKRFRLAGDGLLELGAALELATALAPSWFLPLACTANVSKNLAAVAASATRAPIYAAFARCNNVADLAAKGESVANLADVVGTGVGIALARAGVPTLPAFGLLSVGYLVASRKEVDAVVLPGFNRARLALAAQDALRGRGLPTPVQAAAREPIVFDPASRRVVIGARVQDAFVGARDFRAAIEARQPGGRARARGAGVGAATAARSVGAVAEAGGPSPPLPPYLVSYRPDHRRAYVVLSERATQRDALAGALEAHALAEAMDAFREREAGGDAGRASVPAAPSLLSVSKPLRDIAAFEADLRAAAEGKESTIGQAGDARSRRGAPGGGLGAALRRLRGRRAPERGGGALPAFPPERSDDPHERALEYLARNGPRLHVAFFEAATEAGWELQQTTLGALDTRIVSA